MLVLSRCIDEVLVVGSDIKVKILEIKGNQVRLGIEAPRSVSVNREEVYTRMRAGVPGPKERSLRSIPGGFESKSDDSSDH